MADFEFNQQQQAAIEQAVVWYKGWQDRRHRKQVFFLAGYAGSGKTSLAQHIASLCVAPHRVVYIAPTGKAASRLRQKGCRNAKTLHQFIYNMRGEDEDGEPIFVGKGFLEEQPHLVVCDEGSMIGEYDNRKLLEHGIPVLMLGDIGQVPAVKAKSAYTEDNTDVLLTQIERQSENSNIVRASMFVRDGKRLPLSSVYDDVKVVSSVDDQTFIRYSADDSQIICSRNETRMALNNKARALRGLTGQHPEIGEKLVCTFNQHGYGFMNGEQGVVLGFHSMSDDDMDDDTPPQMLMVELVSLTTEKTIRVKYNPLCFDKNADVRTKAQKAVGGFDFGYALTIHKSQGSEWPNVIVYEEIMKNVSYAKMMYTAITRAIDKLIIVRAN